MHMFSDSVTLNIASKNTIEVLENDIESVNESLPKDIGMGILWQSMNIDGECLNMVYSYPEDYFTMYSQEYFDNDKIASSLVKSIPEWLVKKINTFNITLVYHIQNAADSSQEYIVKISPSRLKELKEYADSHSSVLDMLRSQFELMEIPLEVEEGVSLTSAEIVGNDVIYTYTIDRDLYYDDEVLSEIKKSVIQEFSANNNIVKGIKEEGVHFVYVYKYKDGEVNARMEILPEEF